VNADATGSEWDWFGFFWKMHAASTDAWSTPELMEVWLETIAEEGCCHKTATPPLCSFGVGPDECDAPSDTDSDPAPNWDWIEFGETWSDLWATAQTLQSGTKLTRFNTEGFNAKIQY
jgi:hypothetical protein